MKYTYLFLLLWLPILSIAQIQGEDEVYLNGDYIEAKFQGGGILKFQDFVHEHFNFTKVQKTGKIVATFTIDKEGNIKNIRLLEFIDSESAMEMLRVLNSCPKWEPAKRGGRPITIDIKFPMVFRNT